MYEFFALPTRKLKFKFDHFEQGFNIEVFKKDVFINITEHCLKDFRRVVLIKILLDFHHQWVAAGELFDENL